MKIWGKSRCGWKCQGSMGLGSPLGIQVERKYLRHVRVNSRWLPSRLSVTATPRLMLEGYLLSACLGTWTLTPSIPKTSQVSQWVLATPVLAHRPFSTPKHRVSVSVKDRLPNSEEKAVKEDTNILALVSTCTRSQVLTPACKSKHTCVHAHTETGMYTPPHTHTTLNKIQQNSFGSELWAPPGGVRRGTWEEWGEQKPRQVVHSYTERVSLRPRQSRLGKPWPATGGMWDSRYLPSHPASQKGSWDWD